MNSNDHQTDLYSLLLLELDGQVSSTTHSNSANQSPTSSTPVEPVPDLSGPSECRLQDPFYKCEAKCSLCGRYLALAHDPQLLPCLHSACLSCIRGEREKFCRFCKRTFEVNHVQRNLFMVKNAIDCKSLDEESVLLDELIRCRHHRSHYLDMYCVQCLRMACSECNSLIDDHFEHCSQVQKVDKVFKPLKQSLLKWKRTMTVNQLINSKTVLKELTKKEDQLRSQEAAAMARIRDCEQQLWNKVKLVFNEMRAQLAAACRRERLRIGQDTSIVKKFARDVREAQNNVAFILKQECLPAILMNSALLSEYAMEWSKRLVPKSNSLTNELQLNITYHSELVDQMVESELRQAITVSIQSGQALPMANVQLIDSSKEQAAVQDGDLLRTQLEQAPTPLDVCPSARKRSRQESMDNSMITPPFSPAVNGNAAFGYPVIPILEPGNQTNANYEEPQQLLYLDSSYLEQFGCYQQPLVQPVQTDQDQGEVMGENGQEGQGQDQTREDHQEETTDISSMIGTLLFDCLESTTTN